MITATEHLPNSRVKLTMTATAADFLKAFDEELEDIAKDLKIQGFRPGKAPRTKVIAQVGRQRIEAGALDRTLSSVYFRDIKAADLVPLEGPKVDIKEYKAPAEETPAETETVSFTAEVDVVPEVKLGDYKKKLKLQKKEVPEIAEDEVERVIAYLRKQKAEIAEAGADATAEEGMWVDLGYEGSVDGVSRTDMINKNHPIVIGEGQLIPGFEPNLVGMKVGEVKTFKITFPKDYQATELAGKEAEFTVTINELKNVVLPALDEAFADGFGHDTVDQLTEAIRENLKEEKKEQVHKERDDEVLSELLKLVDFELPQVLVEQELERMFTDSRERLERMNFQWDTYLQQTGKTAEELREEMRPQAEKSVKIGLALGKIIEEEKLEGGEKAGHEAVLRLVELAEANA